jgi:hypothetical protein
MPPKPIRAVDKSSLNWVIRFGCIWEWKDFQPVGRPNYILKGMVHFKSLRGSIITHCSVTFNVSNLSRFDVGDDSRTNLFEERGNVENQQASLKESLHVPVTRARSKMIKEALSGLIQEIWAGSKMEHSNLGPKEDEGVINLI